jgi:hypothetical protein
MRDETVAVGAKAVATAATAAGAFGLTWWAVAAALVGAAAAYHFEPEQVPAKVPRLIFGIFATGFAAAFAAVAAPHIPFMGWTDAIPIGVRAGLLGLTIRFLIDQGKRLARGWRQTGG